MTKCSKTAFYNILFKSDAGIGYLSAITVETAEGKKKF